MYVTWRFGLSSPGRGLRPWSLCFVIACLSATALGPLERGSAAAPQPVIQVRSRAVLTVDDRQFRDANGSGTLDRYEDWRLPVDARVHDLVSRMTLEEKAGLMLIDTMGPGCGGTLTDAAKRLIETQKMARFILRNLVKANADSCDGSVTPGRNGFVVTPRQMADFTNAVQELTESQRLGIPVLFKDNARNHYETDPRFGISAGAGAFTEFPKEAGIAAAALGVGDMSPVRALADVMSREWRAIGLRGMYGYMADLATEPRWYRVQETFTEDADLNADIMRTLVKGLQGGPVSPSTAVALTIKHFPGGGPQELGLDPHYSFGKRQVYPGGRFEYHLKPFMAAIDAGVSSVMPYYGVPTNVTYRGVAYGPTGFAFSKEIVTDLLRGRLGFAGYVNSDTGIISDRAWGLEQRTVPERAAAAINGGTDILSGFNSNTTITDLVRANLVSAARIDEAVKRLLTEQFRLGPVRESLRGRERRDEHPWQCGESRTRVCSSEAVDRAAAEPEPTGRWEAASAAGRREGLHDRDGEGGGRTVRLHRHRRQYCAGPDAPQRSRQRRRDHPRAGPQREHGRVSVERRHHRSQSGTAQPADRQDVGR